MLARPYVPCKIFLLTCLILLLGVVDRGVARAEPSPSVEDLDASSGDRDDYQTTGERLDSMQDEDDDAVEQSVDEELNATQPERRMDRSMGVLASYGWSAPWQKVSAGGRWHRYPQWTYAANLGTGSFNFKGSRELRSTTTKGSAWGVSTAVQWYPLRLVPVHIMPILDSMRFVEQSKPLVLIYQNQVMQR